MDKHYWNRSQALSFQLSDEIVGGFDIGFDAGIPEDTKNTLMDFVYWVEDNYNLPITLWVDFKNRHYLLDPEKRRVRYKFYYVDFENYPVFEKEADIPVIELPVKTGRRALDEILICFIDAISHYFAWLCNDYGCDFLPDAALTKSILGAYLADNPL